MQRLKESIYGIEKKLECERKKMQQHLTNTIHQSGRVKRGMKTAHDYDEKVLTSVHSLLEKLSAIQEQLKDLDDKNARMFKVQFTATNRSSRMKKQNKRQA